MAKLDCDFFPDTPAVWQCGSCNTHYSEKCIPAGQSSHWRQSPRCIRCENELTYLGSATGAKPFWQMLPHFFAYPLHLNSLIVIGVVAALSLLFGWNPMTLFLVLLVLAVVVKYSFAIIEARGRGETAPPQLLVVVTGDEHHLFLRQIAVFIGMGLAVGVAMYVHLWLGLAVAAFLTLAAPASTIVLAVEKSVRRALDPGTLTAMMKAVGLPYLLLWVCTQVIWTGPSLVLPALALILPLPLLAPLSTAITVYFFFVLYTMLGYVLFEYQNELGFDSGLDDDEEMDTQAFEKAKAMGEAAVLIQDGKLDKARKSLRKALDLVKDDADLHMHYHKLLMLLNDDESLANHTNYLMALLKRQKALGRGVPVVLDVQKRLPGFKLDDTGIALELAQLLKMQGKYKAVVKLFLNLHKSHPQDPLVPEAYLMVANIFFEYMGDDAKALALADFVMARYPKSPQIPQFEKLRGVISQPPMASSAAVQP